MDPIERQDVFNLLYSVSQYMGNWLIQYIEEGISSIPPAQPEIRCKNCKHKPSGSGVNHDISFPDEVCPCQCDDYWYSWMPKDDWFCGSWERREE